MTLPTTLPDNGPEAVALVEHYFGPQLDAAQRDRFARLWSVYDEWNRRINVISRRDFGSFYLRHVLHSLAIARVCRFDAGARVLDIGCGGGFPGVPLAILMPDVHFTEADSIGKKITVVREAAAALELSNVTAVNARVETLAERFDYAVTRAVAPLDKLCAWVWPLLQPGRHGSLAAGLLALKGGELAEELALARRPCRRFAISEWFAEPCFESKQVIYVPR